MARRAGGASGRARHARAVQQGARRNLLAEGGLLPAVRDLLAYWWRSLACANRSNCHAAGCASASISAGRRSKGIVLDAHGRTRAGSGRRRRATTTTGVAIAAVVRLVAANDAGSLGSSASACPVRSRTAPAGQERQLHMAQRPCVRSPTWNARSVGPVRVANDADCLALSEAVDGAAAGAASVFAAILGTGTGGGIVIDGVWPGPTRLPASGGTTCFPGRARASGRARLLLRPHGCIETFLSGPGFEQDYAGTRGDAAQRRRRSRSVGAPRRARPRRWRRWHATPIGWRARSRA